MKTTREFILGLSLWCAFCGTATVALPQETADQVRLTALEHVKETVDDHERRIIKLEDAVMVFQDSKSEFTWWLRFIGAAIMLAILERVLRTAGVLSNKTDGLGPVG